MTTLREAAQAALDALEQLQGGCTDHDDGTVEAITVWCPEVIDDLRAALAAEPVVWMHPDGRVVTANTMECALRDGGAMRSSLIDYTIPLYTADAIREAVEAEREACAKLAENTVCDVHLPTGIRIYGYVAARAIRARGAA